MRSQKQLNFLEKMHNGDGPYFNNQEKRVAGKEIDHAYMPVYI
jgi:hypothetical protein